MVEMGETRYMDGLVVAQHRLEQEETHNTGDHQEFLVQQLLILVHTPQAVEADGMVAEAVDNLEVAEVGLVISVECQLSHLKGKYMSHFHQME